MKRALRRGVVTMALAALTAAPVQATADPTTAVVGAGSPDAARAVAADLRDQGLTVTEIPRIGALEVSGDDLAAVRAAVGGDARVDWIEPSRDRTLFAPVAALAPDAIDLTTGRMYGWGAELVNASGGLEMTDAFPVTVAIVDSGVDVGHPDLSGRIGPTWDILTGTTAVTDVVGHGTFVAGLISAIDGNGLGARGVAGATTVIPIRITTTGAIKSADAAAGIVRGVDSGAKVINLSFGGPVISQVEKEALAYAAEKDVLVVAAAGNSYGAGNVLQYPAAAVGGLKGGWSPGLSVAATDPSGLHAPFSTANDFVSLAAPGAAAMSDDCRNGVFSTIPGNPTLLWDGTAPGDCTRVATELTTFGPTGRPVGRYGYAEGTSFSAPLVSGAAALVRDANPALSAPQTADVLTRTADGAGDAGWNQYTGAGVLDVEAAVGMARVYDTQPPAPALAITPRAGALTVSLGGVDRAAPGTILAGISTYRLERSGDGNIFTPVGAAQPSPIRIDETVPAGERRWYRGTVCDGDHNCAVSTSTAVAGGPAASTVVARRVRPTITAASVTRPRGCRTCLRAGFTARGTGPMKFVVTLTPGIGGAASTRHTGTVRVSGRVTTLFSPVRTPACGRSATVSIQVTSDYGKSHVTRTASSGRKCARRTGR